MKIMTCPLNGPRNIAEFTYLGEAGAMPDPRIVGDAAWACHVFGRSGGPGVRREWWLHRPSAFLFVAERDDATGEIVRSLPADDVFEAQAPTGPGGGGLGR